MLSLLTLPVKVIRLFESNTSDSEIAVGVCLGLFMGFLPMNGPWLIVLTVAFLIVNLNRVSTILVFPVFKLAYFLGGYLLTDKLGTWLLVDAEGLRGFWAWVTGLPVIAYLDVNNTLVAGGLVFCSIVSVPLYFVSKMIIGNMRKKYHDKFKGSKFVKAAKKLNPFQGVLDAADNIRNKLQQ